MALASGQVVSKRAERALAAMPTAKVWVFFKSGVNPDSMDTLLRGYGFRKRLTSRWLNGTSGSAAAGALDRIAGLPQVASIDIVERYAKKRPAPLRKETNVRITRDPYYGYSFDELAAMAVPEALSYSGIDSAGKGIVIAVLDAGFNLDHEAFAHFTPTTIVAARDYVAGILDTAIMFDTVVANEPGDTSDQEDHGTSVLSIIAACKPGVMMGVAPFARFILAKTELNDTVDDSGRWHEAEVVGEEDAWIAAVEWAVDTLHADIVTSSLGYRYGFTDGRIDYTLNELNGDSLRITRVADSAASRGTLVFEAVGNEGNQYPSTLSAPADGHNVIAVGAVDANGIVAYYSSVGPTSDGRQKPDVCAPGHMSTIAETGGGYRYDATGTSFATPMAAGVAALFLQYARKTGLSLSTTAINDRIRTTAAKLYGEPVAGGSGMINAFNLLTGSPGLPPVKPEPNAVLFAAFPQPVKGGELSFTLTTDNQTPADMRTGLLSIRIYSLHGELISALDKKEAEVGANTRIVWNATTRSGARVRPGIYCVRATFDGNDGIEYWGKKIAIVR